MASAAEELHDAGGALPESQGALAPLPSAASVLGSEREAVATTPPPRRLGPLGRLKAAVKKLKREVLALHYATQDSSVGLLSRLVVLTAVAYALSPLDLIPDFIPVLGIIDDVIVLGALLGLAVWLIPPDVMAAARERAEHEPLRLRKNWIMALLFFATWDAALLAGVWWGWRAVAASRPQLGPYTAWVVAGVGVAAAAAELAWAAGQWRREARLEAVAEAAGGTPELRQALLRGGSEAVHAYLEP